MGKKKFTFTLEITGIGDTEEEAWLDATEAFDQDPGVCTNRRVAYIDQRSCVIPDITDVPDKELDPDD